jgi:histidyl-tRNA synthetase
MTAKLQAVRGMNDILPDQAALWTQLEHRLQRWLASYGYREIRMPMLEQTPLFVRSIGEVTDIVEKEMYTFEDKLSGEHLTLRPEGTASCLRAVLEHNLLYSGPLRLWYSGPMFRHERPQKGRYRQFHQFGVEALGFPGPDVDAELVIMTARLWRELGLEGYWLELNTLGDGESRTRYRHRLVTYFERHLGLLSPDEVRRLRGNPLRLLDSKNPALAEVIAQAPQFLDDIDAPSRAHFDALQRLLNDNEVSYRINPRLVRGLDYYNATVFEWVTDRLGAQGTFCAGGRYDALMEQLGGKPAPGCGFAMGLERIIALLQESGYGTTPICPDAYVLHQGEDASHRAMSVAERLRSAGLTAILHCGGGGFKSQMKKADASAARFAVIIGENEVGAAKVTVKPMRGQGDQQMLDLEAAIELIKRDEGHGGIRS